MAHKLRPRNASVTLVAIPGSWRLAVPGGFIKMSRIVLKLIELVAPAGAPVPSVGRGAIRAHQELEKQSTTQVP